MLIFVEPGTKRFNLTVLLGKKSQKNLNLDFLVTRVQEIFDFCSFKTEDFYGLVVRGACEEEAFSDREKLKKLLATDYGLRESTGDKEDTLEFTFSSPYPPGTAHPELTPKIFVFSEPKSTLALLKSHKTVKGYSAPKGLKSPDEFCIEQFSSRELVEDVCFEEYRSLPDLSFVNIIHNPLNYVIHELARTLRKLYYFESLDLERAYKRRKRLSVFIKSDQYKKAEKNGCVRAAFADFFSEDDRTYNSKTVIFPEILVNIDTLKKETGEEQMDLSHWSAFFEKGLLYQTKKTKVEIKKITFSSESPGALESVRFVLRYLTLEKLDVVIA